MSDVLIPVPVPVAASAAAIAWAGLPKMPSAPVRSCFFVRVHGVGPLVFKRYRVIGQS